MINVFFHGSGTWFNKNDGSLLYPLIDKTRLNYCFPPVHSINGIFSINDEDAKIHTYTGNLDHIPKLYPNTQPDSAFLKMVSNGILLDEDINHCYFKLPRKRKKATWSKVERSKPILVIAPTKTISKKRNHNKNSLSEDQLNKIKSLKAFILEFGAHRKNQGLNFDSTYMKCNEKDLLIALKKWSKKRDKETQKLWNIKRLSNIDIWSLKQRKDICELLPQGRHFEREADYFKIVGY